MNRLLQSVTLPAPSANESNAAPIIRSMVDNIGSHQQVKIDRYWYMTPKDFYHPAHFSLSTQEFIECMAHEMAHSEEFVQGQESMLELASVGLDHYTHTNEGRAVAIEQIANSSFEQFASKARWHEILGRHLAVSLSCSLGHQKNTVSFPRIFSIIRDMSVVYKALAEPETPFHVILQQADDQAWNIATTVYAGTDASFNGGGLRRAMLYLEGNIFVWHDEMKQPGAIERGALAKFNEHSTTQRKLIRMVGRLPLVR